MMSDLSLDDYSDEFIVKLLQSELENDSNGQTTKTTQTPSPPYKLLTREEKNEIRYIKRSKFDDLNSISNLNSIADYNSKKIDDSMNLLLQKSILINLHKKNIKHINKSTLFELSNLTTQYLDILSSNLHKLSEIQRRRKPSGLDLKLLLREKYFSLNDVEDELIETKNYINSSNNNNNSQILSKINKINDDSKTLIDSITTTNEFDVVTSDDPSFVFFNDISSVILDIIPPQSNDQRPYIPNYLPPVPPEHTFKATPKYSTLLSDPRKLKRILVEEGRLGEKALNHIMITNKSSSPSSSFAVTSSIEDQSESDLDANDKNNLSDLDSESNEKEQENEKIEPESEKTDKDNDNSSNLLIDHLPKITDNENKENIDKEKELKSLDSPPAPQQQQETNTKPKIKLNLSNNTIRITNKKDSFDIVEFANKRMKILEKRRLEEENLINKRIHSEESKLGKHFGAYKNENHYPDNLNIELNNLLISKYKFVNKSIRLSEIKKRKRLEKEEEVLRKLEEERIKKSAVQDFEFQFDEDDNNVVDDFDIDESEINFEDDLVGKESDGLKEKKIESNSDSNDNIRTENSAEPENADKDNTVDKDKTVTSVETTEVNVEHGNTQDGGEIVSETKEATISSENLVSTDNSTAETNPVPVEEDTSNEKKLDAKTDTTEVAVEPATSTSTPAPTPVPTTSNGNITSVPQVVKPAASLDEIEITLPDLGSVADGDAANLDPMNEDDEMDVGDIEFEDIEMEE
ncbi:hypothetical protein B5S30_g2061 [[Candida] boidinii]|nr:hypothetical protein B5S30_g2061 [[Candida] boidinii]